MTWALEEFQRENLKIITKKGQLVSFVPNIYQQELNRIVEEQIKDRKPVRLRSLKCRQIGVSTWASSLVYYFSSTDFYKKALIIAHDSDSSSGIFEMTKRFWEFSLYKPLRKNSNAKEVIFDNPKDDKQIGLKSEIQIETANNLTAGRSKTIQCLHMSEKAFWRDAATLQTGLYQSIPYDSGTIIIDESTANGISGIGKQFYEDWNDSDFTSVFFKWTHNKDYEMDYGPDFIPTHYEKELMKLHPELNLRKLAFRRFKIKNEMGSALMDAETQFKQEYPFDPQEAFISSGRPVFDILKIQKDIQRAKEIKFELGEV